MTSEAFAKWQKVSIPNDKGSTTDFIIYRDRNYTQRGYENLYHVGDIERRSITGVSVHLHGAKNIEDIGKACIGCQHCTEWECCEYEEYERSSDTPTQDAKIIHCIHAKALVTYLKNRPDDWERDYDEHVGSWVSNFEVERSPR